LKAENGSQHFEVDSYEYDEKGIRVLPNWVCQPHLRVPLPEFSSQDKNKEEEVTSNPQESSQTHNREDVLKAREERKRKAAERISNRKGML
jgi:hypothetical protein